MTIKNERKVYSRKLIRKILKSQLKTNKIRDAFHDKNWLKVFIDTL